MAIQEVLLLGNPHLYEVSEPVRKKERDSLKSLVRDLHDTLIDFRQRYHAGRAIAAPQIGVMKRLLYMHMDEPKVFINPVLSKKSDDFIEVWDDCLCFPELLVMVRRHASCTITFRNLEWREEKMHLEGDQSELLQHEYDHLDGILAVSRAMNNRSFALRNQKTQG